MRLLHLTQKSFGSFPHSKDLELPQVYASIPTRVREYVLPPLVYHGYTRRTGVIPKVYPEVHHGIRTRQCLWVSTGALPLIQEYLGGIPVEDHQYTGQERVQDEDPRGPPSVDP